MKPQCDVFVQKYETLNTVPGKTGSGGFASQGCEYDYVVTVCISAFNGNSICRALHIIAAPVFSSGHGIVLLPVFPIKHYTDFTCVKTSREYFVQRGTKNLRLAKRPVVCGCTGQDLDPASLKLFSISHALLALIRITII